MTSKELKVAEVGVNLSFVIKSNLSFEKKKVFFLYADTLYKNFIRIGKKTFSLLALLL